MVKGKQRATEQGKKRATEQEVADARKTAELRDFEEFGIIVPKEKSKSTAKLPDLEIPQEIAGKKRATEQEVAGARENAKLARKNLEKYGIPVPSVGIEPPSNAPNIRKFLYWVEVNDKFRQSYDHWNSLGGSKIIEEKRKEAIPEPKAKQNVSWADLVKQNVSWANLDNLTDEEFDNYLALELENAKTPTTIANVDKTPTTIANVDETLAEAVKMVDENNSDYTDVDEGDTYDSPQSQTPVTASHRPKNDDNVSVPVYSLKNVKFDAKSGTVTPQKKVSDFDSKAVFPSLTPIKSIYTDKTTDDFKENFLRKLFPEILGKIDASDPNELSEAYKFAKELTEEQKIKLGMSRLKSFRPGYVKIPRTFQDQYDEYANEKAEQRRLEEYERLKGRLEVEQKQALQNKKKEQEMKKNLFKKKDPRSNLPKIKFPKIKSPKKTKK